MVGTLLSQIKMSEDAVKAKLQLADIKTPELVKWGGGGDMSVPDMDPWHTYLSCPSSPWFRGCSSFSSSAGISLFLASFLSWVRPGQRNPRFGCLFLAPLKKEEEGERRTRYPWIKKHHLESLPISNSQPKPPKTL